MDGSELLVWLQERGVEFRLPELLWTLLLVPALGVLLGVARSQRRRVADSFRVVRPAQRRRRAPGTFVRLLALVLLLLSIAAMIVGFARPVVPLVTPDDAATVVFVVDGSMAMRATDVNPTRFEAARGVAQAAVRALPDRLQVAVVSYSAAAYIVLAPTHDQGAAPGAVGRIRTAEGAALGDALAVALAAVPLRDPAALPDASAPAATAPAPAPAPGQSTLTAKVPAAIVLLSSGEISSGRPLDEAIAAIRDAGVPVHTVPIGPRPGAERKAPFDENVLRQIAGATGGRYLAAPSSGDWRELYKGMGSSVTVDLKPQEIGHFVGAGALAVAALAMLASTLATRRLV
jgi:Ca-activated chloride channel family protein